MFPTCFHIDPAWRCWPQRDYWLSPAGRIFVELLPKYHRPRTVHCNLLELMGKKAFYFIMALNVYEGGSDHGTVAQRLWPQPRWDVWYDKREGKVVSQGQMGFRLSATTETCFPVFLFGLRRHSRSGPCSVIIYKRAGVWTSVLSLVERSCCRYWRLLKVHLTLISSSAYSPWCDHE